MTIDAVIKKTNAHYCLECGICTGSCPISRINPKYSPRLFVEKSLLISEDELIRDHDLWTCLTCGACSARCPSLVNYNDFMFQMRQLAIEIDNRGICTHAGTIQAVSSLQTKKFVKKDLSWIPKELKIKQKGDVLFFVGCTPYYQIIFENIKADSLNASKSTIKILNKFGIEPVVSQHERCCGHDSYWTGELDKFKTLAESNLEMIKNSGANKVIFSCAEGYSTFKSVYTQFFGKLKFDVLHISQFIAEKLDSEEVTFNEINEKVTFHDPCRLGRFEKESEAPRKVLSAIPGLEILEMERNRENALCCGSSTWMNCTQVNKRIQVDRLKEAEKTSASTLVTACPKCKIHLNCTMSDNGFDYKIKIKDLATLVAEAI